MKRTIITIGLAVLFLAAGVMANPGMGMGKRGGSGGDCRMGQAFHDGHGQRGCGGQTGQGLRMLLRHADDLELTEAQIEQLDGLEVDFQTERIDAQAELKKASVKLRSLMRNDDASETEVNAAIDHQARLRADMQKMRYRHHRTVQNILTEEQQNKLEKLARQPRFGFWIEDDDDDEDDEDEVIIRRRRDRIHR